MGYTSGTRMKRVRTYSILSRVFLPVGLVLLILGVAMLVAGIVGATIFTTKAIEAGQCTQSASGTSCTILPGDAVAFTFSILGIVFGSLGFTFGLPMFILSFVFSGRARANRELDEKMGVDYTDFPYGK